MSRESDVIQLCKVISKYASYTNGVIETGLTPKDAIELRDRLMSEPRQPFVSYDAVWE